MMKTISRILRDERGDVEDLPSLTILLVGIVCPMIAVVIFFGRYGMTEVSVQSAASAAARDASLSRSAAEAVPHAEDAAELALDAGGTDCINLDVTISGNGLTTGLGQTGNVTVEIECTISNADLLVPLIPGTSTITKSATSPVDPYRER